MPIVASTGGFSRLLAPGLRKVYGDQFEGQETEYDKILNVLSSKRNYEEDLRTALLGTTPTKPEGSPTFFDKPTQGNVIRYTHVSYGLGFRVTKEMWDDDLYGVMKKASRDLADANSETIEVQAASVLNLATTATAYAGFDGLSLCSTAHVLMNGSTYSNRHSSDAELSQAALQVACDSFYRMVTEKGRRIRTRPWRIVIPPELKWVAREILLSPFKTGLSSGPGNEINAVREDDLNYFIMRYIVSPKHWHLIGKNHDVNFFWRTKAQFGNDDEFSTGDALFKTFMRFSQGFGEWRGWFGSFPT